LDPDVDIATWPLFGACHRPKQTDIDEMKALLPIGSMPAQNSEHRIRHWGLVGRSRGKRHRVRADGSILKPIKPASCSLPN